MIFNYIINPLGVFPQVIKQYSIKDWEQHTDKYYHLKINCDKTKYKRVIVGCSTVSLAFGSNDVGQYVLWSPAASMDFLIDAFDAFLANHPTVEEVYFGADLSLFININFWNKNFKKETH